MTNQRFRAAVFDLDGLLIDSEPLWRVAERAVFGRVGIELTDAQCEETMGLRSDEVIEYWYERFPWSEPSREAIERELLAEVRDLIANRGRALPGVASILARLHESGLPLAVASSSPKVLIEAALARLGVADYFEVVCSAADEERGKPDPAVYRSAVNALGLDPTSCVAFEDSLPGIQSGQAAGLFVIAIPATSDFEDPRFTGADLRFRSLEEPALARLMGLDN